MRRATRSSKASKPTKAPQKSKPDPLCEDEQPSARRKSLRSGTKAPSSSTSTAPLNSMSTHASSIATRSGRKRLSVSTEDQEEEQKMTPKAERGVKRRRTSAPALPRPEPRQNVTNSTSGSGRMRRGAQKESSNSSVSPSTPATKKAKIAPPAQIGLLKHFMFSSFLNDF